MTSSNKTEAHRHTMLRPRKWWHTIFRKYGAEVNTLMTWAMQEKDHSYKGNELYDCRQEGNESEGGLYEVCVVNNTWLVGNRQQAHVRLDRCITTSNNELEPWFFSFVKVR
jgi:hypothetical protein